MDTSSLDVCVQILVATFRVAKLTFRAPELWLVGWLVSRLTVTHVTIETKKIQNQKKSKNEKSSVYKNK